MNPRSEASRRQTDSSAALAAVCGPAPLIDFLPQSIHTESQRKRDRPLRQLVLLAGMVLFVAGTIMHHQRTAELRERLTALQTQQESGLKPGLADEKRRTLSELTERANLLATFTPAVSASRVVAAISAAVPQPGHLTTLELRTETRPGWQPPEPIRDSSAWVADLAERTAAADRDRLVVRIDGLVNDDDALGQLMQTLRREGLFSSQQVELAEPAELRGLPHRRFRVSAVPNSSRHD